MKTMRVVLYGLRGETVADVVSIRRSRLARGERSFKPWFGRDRRCHRSSLPVVCCWESATEADFGPSRAHSGRASEIITFHDDSWAEVFRKASSAPRALPSAHHLRRVHGAIGTDLAQDANQLAPGRPGLAPLMCWKNQLSGFTIFSTSDLRPTSAQGVKLLREFTGKSASTQGIQIFLSLARNRSPWCTRLADHPEG